MSLYSCLDEFLTLPPASRSSLTSSHSSQSRKLLILIFKKSRYLYYFVLDTERHRLFDKYDKNVDRERDWNRPRTPAGARSPDTNHHSHSRVSSTGSQGSYISTLQRRTSTPSINFERESSKGSSMGSQAECEFKLR